MLRPLRIILGQISYFFEKYMNVDGLPVTIIVFALCTAVTAVTVVKPVECLWKKKHECGSFLAGCLAVTTAMTLPFGWLMSTPYTWNSKLQRVMSNFLYVMSFEANSTPFMTALGLKDDDQLFRTAMTLSDSQWKDVVEEAGESGWYFEKIQKGIDSVLHFWKFDLSSAVFSQNILALIPAMVVILLGIYFFMKKRRACGVVVLTAVVLSLMMNLGADIFVLFSIFFSILLWVITGPGWNRMFRIEKQKN